MKSFLIINGLSYTLGWLICVLSGAFGFPYLPLPFILTFLFIHFYYLKIKNEKEYFQDLLLLPYTIIIGLFIEIFILYFEIVLYKTPSFAASILPPIWIWLLYFIFSTTINHSLAYLFSYKISSFLLGFFGGPLSYIAGAALGAVVLKQLYSLTVLALIWGIFLLTLHFIMKRINQLVSAYISPSYSHLYVLYDDVCPICSKEINHLSKRDQNHYVSFIPIGTKQQLKENFSHFDYDKVMKEIHVFDEAENIHIGVDAFSQMYSRTNHKFLALILQAPILKTIFIWLYKLWTIYRLHNRKKYTKINED
ncbi:MAG: hypothetical protein Tsb0021_05270 [Chlamydiales bacterium]